MECNDIVKQLDGWVDHELSYGEARKVETHLGNCPACSRKAKSLIELVRAMESLPGIPAPKGFSRQVCLALRPHIEYPDLVQWWRHLTPAWRSAVCGVAVAGLLCGGLLGKSLAESPYNDTRPVLYLSLADTGVFYP